MYACQTVSLQLSLFSSDCDQFELSPPELPMLDDMEKDLLEYESNYLLYEKFNEELQTMGNEEWIIFRFDCPSSIHSRAPTLEAKLTCSTSCCRIGWRS